MPVDASFALRLPAEATAVWPLASAFLICLVRLGGLFVFFPWPGGKATSVVPRVFLTVAVSASLAPRLEAGPLLANAGTMTQVLLGEAALGFSAGLVLLFMMEALGFAGHMIGMQAGFSYASSIDPTTEADSAIIPVMIQWLGNVLFFVGGFDRWLMRAMVTSLDRIPPGAWQLSGGSFEMVTRLLSDALALGLRLALPVAGFLLLVDLTLAVVGRLNAQFPLLNMAFPLKTGLAALSLGATIGLVPGNYARLMEMAGEALGGVLRWP